MLAAFEAYDVVAPAVVQTRSADGYARLSEVEKSAMDKLERLEKLFVGRHFDREVILLCVRWYLRFKLSRVTWLR